MTASDLDPCPSGRLDQARFDLIMGLFEDLPGGGRACMLDPFLGMLDLQVPRLEQALAAGHHEALREAAHTLKGSSRELGFLRLGDCSEAIERAAREARLPEHATQEAFAQEVAWVRRFIDLA